MSSVSTRLLFATASYLVGAIPTGYLFFRAGGNEDIRTLGSGATGATNVLRLRGWRLAVPVALLDMAKGFLPAFLAARLFPFPAYFAALCASLAVIGHCYPIYIGFRGGKGVSVAAGAMFALAPIPALGCLSLFVMVVGLTRYVSLGSILAAIAFPGLLVWLRFPSRIILACLPICAVILIRHRSNIGRLLRGAERKIGRSAKVAP